MPLWVIAQQIVSEVITGLIGGGIVAVTGIGYAYYRRKRIERLYPIAGRYLSFFEDLQDGRKVVVRSESRISQRGKSVHIVTALVNKRSWTLEGNILPGGHISGVYSADAVYDDGVGSFYLKINHNNLDGMWNGYDHENRTAAAGRYWFRRMLKADIRESGHSDINDILQTATNAFGNGYLTAASLVNDDRHFSLVAEVDGEFAAFCLGYRLESDHISDFVKMPTGTLPGDVAYADSHGSLGTIKTIAVRRRFRGHGIGASLIREAEKKLVSRRVTCIVVPAWKMNGEVYLHNILEDQDYSRWIEHAAFWEAECEAREFACTAFDGQCRCGVVFYRKGRLAGS